MNYFEAINKRCDELTDIAQKYLDELEFISNQECIERIFKVAEKIFKEHNENWDTIPDWVADTMDYAIPYSYIPSNGSLYYSLGYSVVAQDANLRKLLEHAEGREENIDFFVCLAEKDIVDKYCKN